MTRMWNSFHTVFHLFCTCVSTAVSFRFSETLYTVSEGSGSITVAVEMFGDTSGQYSILVMTINGTAKGKFLSRICPLLFACDLV